MITESRRIIAKVKQIAVAVVEAFLSRTVPEGRGFKMAAHLGDILPGIEC